MASARQLSKDVGLRSATNRQRLNLKPQLSSELVGTSGAVDLNLPLSSGDKNSTFLYDREQLIIVLGEHFYSKIMVLAHQATKSSNEASFRDIADGIYKHGESYISKDTQIRAFALLMYHYGLEDANNSDTAAKLCARLAALEAGGLKFRSPLLKQCQEDFTTRASWRESDPNRWLAFCCYLCCLFRYLKIGEEHINTLIEPVFTCLDSILSDTFASDEEMKCACDQLKEVGPVLDTIKPSQMDTLITVIKEKLLGPQASHFSRLLLLELVELRASSWELTDTQTQYYSEVFC